MRENKPHVQLEPPDQLVENTREFWREMAKEQIKRSISSVDEAAKQIIGVTTILEGLYFNAITFSKLQGKMAIGWPLFIYLAPILLLLVSLCTSLLVFFPNYYRLNLHSSEGSRAVHEQVVRRKMRLQRIASIFLMLSVLSLFFAVLTYLHG